MKYKYFVSYSFASNGNLGHGCVEISTSRRVTTYEDVKGIVAWLDANIKGSDGSRAKCVVLNYKRLAWWIFW